MKKLPEKLKGYKQYESIKFSLQNTVYDYLTTAKFEKSWNKMVENFHLESNEWLIGLYNERRRWVPSFVKDNFWAGMSTTQRSESMHAFFDGYVNSKTTLKQFVEQYENALKSKVQNENYEYFNSFNSRVPCITVYGMEKQFQDAYTTSKFRKVQQELTGKMYCEVLPSIKEQGSICQYEVSEDLKVGEGIRRSIFSVWLNKVECEEECEIKCACHLFEFRGILCKHAISVLIHKRIYYIPSKYIIRRWRKDVKRSHTKVRISYDDWSDKPKGRRYDKMCSAFHEIAELANDSEDKCNKVMNWIRDLNGELCTNEGVSRRNQPTPNSTSEKSFGGDANVVIKEGRNILTPLPVRAKGWPPFKRKQSKIEQVVNKNEAKKNGKCQVKGNKASQNMNCEIGISDGSNTFKISNVIQLQDSNFSTDSQNFQSIQVGRSDLPSSPFHNRQFGAQQLHFAHDTIDFIPPQASDYVLPQQLMPRPMFGQSTLAPQQLFPGVMTRHSMLASQQLLPSVVPQSSSLVPQPQGVMQASSFSQLMKHQENITLRDDGRGSTKK